MKITVQHPRMHCKSEAKRKWCQNFGLFLADKISENTLLNGAMTFKLVSKELILSFISLVFLVEKYPVVLPHEITENLKWKLGQ